MNLVTDKSRGNQLRLARIYRDITQCRLAKKSGISQSLISQYERGLKPIPEEHQQILMKKLFFPVGFINKVMPKLLTSLDFRTYEKVNRRNRKV